MVAALAMPGLISSTKDAITASRWKKAYSSVNQAYTSVLADKGGTIANSCTDAECLNALLTPYFKIYKSCTSANYATCWTVSSLFFETPAYAALPPAGYTAFTSNPDSVTILVDGTVLAYNFISTNCTDTTKTGLADCGVITVDIDGPKGKHVAGEDLFALHIQATGLKPFGSRGDNYYDKCDNSDKTGCGFAYLSK